MWVAFLAAGTGVIAIAVALSGQGGVDLAQEADITYLIGSDLRTETRPSSPAVGATANPCRHRSARSR